jgi:hypothetical protein
MACNSIKKLENTGQTMLISASAATDQSKIFYRFFTIRALLAALVRPPNKILATSAVDEFQVLQG